MPGIKLEKNATRYFHSYRDDDAFHAEIIMNTRDAMVFGEIKSLPQSKEEIEIVLKEFVDIFTKKYGAKSVLTISLALHDKIPGDILKPGKCDARYISAEDTKAAIKTIREKQHVIIQLEKFKTGEYKFLTKEDLQLRTAEINEFKIKYASFIDETKIKRGQYSKTAEDEKLNNPYVEHYAIEHNGKIIACVMHVMHGDYTYDADFIVHPDYRSKDANHPNGVGQALSVKVYEDMKVKWPNIKGSWLIAGGYGTLDVGAHLYDHVFPTEYLKEKPQLQKQLGFFLMFGGPGQEFFMAANRDPQTSFVLNEEHDVNAALEILKQSKEPALAAKQPEPPQQIPQSEKVVGISIFTNLDKSPKETRIQQEQKTLGFGNN